ncbi:MAG: MarR family transcriptional regulator [Candidatus Competibacteraceae bacterium]|nr:MarR family transcriptional regulator [Candidatus Competibacteraceae bacterium]
MAEIGQMHFEGNIIPHPWYQRITLESGKPDLSAIILLAEIIYWYRPYQTLDKHGKPLLRKHFDGDMFQCTAAYFETKFGLTKDQARKALKRLEDAGYIRREYRSIVQQGILRNNIMFIEPVPLAILAITHPTEATNPPLPASDTPLPASDTLSPVGDTLSPVGDIFKGIEITTKISTKTTTTTTTPNPSATNERTVESESTRGGSGGTQDEKTKAQDTHPGIATLEPNEEKTAALSRCSVDG